MALTSINRKAVHILCDKDLPQERVQIAISAINDLCKFAHTTLPIVTIREGRPAKILKEGIKGSRTVGRKLQLGAHEILDKMIKDIRKDFPANLHYDLFLTDQDIFGDEETNWIFGVSQEGYASVFSFNRFLTIKGPMAAETAKTVLMHEMGHVFSLPGREEPNIEEQLGRHCTDKCLMRQGMSLTAMKKIAEDRLAGRDLCELCQQDLMRFFWSSATPRYQRNPDEEVRRLERLVAQDFDQSNYDLLNVARARAGLLPAPRVFQFSQGWQAQTKLPNGDIVSSATQVHSGWWGIGHVYIKETEETPQDLGHHAVCTFRGEEEKNASTPTKEEVVRAHQQVVAVFCQRKDADPLYIAHSPWTWGGSGWSDGTQYARRIIR